MIEFTSTAHQDPQRMTPDLLGGKGYHLCVMAQASLPIPNAAILTTEVYTEYFGGGKKVTDAAIKEIRELVDPVIWTVENQATLISVRSGAKISMPGMMDTILNVGITSKTRPALQERYGKELVEALEVRLIKMYADVVFDLDLEKVGVCTTPAGARALFESSTGIPFFDTVEEQIVNAVLAVFKSWDNDRAVKYREINNIPHDIGTAVVLQKMVFGNMDDNSCTGVYFSSNPNTGELAPTGEFLIRAQGEDVVSGEVTPEPLDSFGTSELHNGMVEAMDQLRDLGNQLEYHFRDIQDIEFTVESGKLYILQTRSAKRTDTAALKYITNCVTERNWIMEGTKAFTYITPELIGRMFKEQVDPSAKGNLMHVASGLAVGGGIAQGIIETDRAEVTPGNIYLADHTTPDDLDAMLDSEGVITRVGGATSHAAIVARSLGKPAVVGIGSDLLFSKGTHVVIDGDTGRIYKTKDGNPVALVPGKATPEYLEFCEKVWGVTVDEQTTYIRPLPLLDTPSCIQRVFGHPAPIADAVVPKESLTEDDVPEAVKAFLKEVNVSSAAMKTILSQGFRLKDSCYDSDPVVVAMHKLTEFKD